MADIDGELYVRTNGDVDDKVQSKIVDYTNPTQGMEVDTENDAHVKAKLRDENGDAFGTEVNPVYVVETTDPSPIIIDYDGTTATASDGSDSHTFAPTNDTRINKILCSASGYAKYEIRYGASPTLNSLVVFTEPSSRTFCLELPNPIVLTGGTDSLIIVKTNLDNKPQDLYSTVVGQEF